MKTTGHFPTFLAALFVVSPLAPHFSTALAAGSAFTYQGKLTDGGQPANGSYDLRFILFDVPEFGTPVSSILTNEDTLVVDGLFTASLDFGPQPFDGTPYWLEIGVRPAASTGFFTTLQPRQALSAAPYAIHSSDASSAATALTVALGAVSTAGLVDGAVSAAKLASGAVTSTALANGAVGSAALANGAVTTAKLAANAVTSDKILDGTIGTTDLANGAITAAKLAPGTVPKFISLDVLGIHIEGAATVITGFGRNSGVALPDGNTSSAIEAAFTIPPDYTPGTPLTIHMLWHTPSTGCNFRFAENYISVGRAGRTHLVGGGVTTGLQIVGGTVLAAAATANQSTETLIQVTSPVTGLNLAPGDSIHFSLFRNSGSTTDTCTGNMVIQGLWVTYN